MGKGSDFYLSIDLRLVKREDCDLLFSWVNEEAVRRNAFNSNLISYEEHKKWFENKLKDENSIIYICYIQDKVIGQIRVDITGCSGVIDYSIAKEFRGKGYGTEVLKEITKELKRSRPWINRLAGRVKHNNSPSEKAFKKAGYDWKITEDYIEFIKIL